MIIFLLSFAVLCGLGAIAALRIAGAASDGLARYDEENLPTEPQPSAQSWPSYADVDSDGADCRNYAGRPVTAVERFEENMRQFRDRVR